MFRSEAAALVETNRKRATRSVGVDGFGYKSANPLMEADAGCSCCRSASFHIYIVRLRPSSSRSPMLLLLLLLLTCCNRCDTFAPVLLTTRYRAGTSTHVCTRKGASDPVFIQAMLLCSCDEKSNCLHGDCIMLIVRRVQKKKENEG